MNTLARWLADYYLLATLLLAVSLIAGQCIAQPARRVALVRATLASLALLAVLVWRVVRDELTVRVLERPAFAGAQPDTLAKSRPHRLQRSQDLRLLIDDAEGGEQDGEGPVGVIGVEGGLGVSSDARIEAIGPQGRLVEHE